MNETAKRMAVGEPSEMESKTLLSRYIKRDISRSYGTALRSNSVNEARAASQDRMGGSYSHLDLQARLNNSLIDERMEERIMR